MTDFLAQLDATPDDQKYPLVYSWIKSDKALPFFKQMREHRPILQFQNYTLVSKFNDIRDVLLMPKIFTVDLYGPKMSKSESNIGYFMAHDDNAVHTREKSIMRSLLNRDDLLAVRKLVSGVCQDLLNSWKNQQDVELVNGYARQVPIELVRQYFGMDGASDEKMAEWSYWTHFDFFYNHPFNLYSEARMQEITSRSEQALEEMTKYVPKLIARKFLSVLVKDLPFGWFMKFEQDIVKRMVIARYAKSVDFSIVRSAANLFGLLNGAIETTAIAAIKATHFIFSNPDVLAQAKASSHNNDEFDKVVWESLRFSPMTPFLFRKLSQDFTLAKGTDWQTTLEKDTIVIALTHSAMFDDQAFSHPDEFDRNNTSYNNFLFGFGDHDCLAKHVGFVMISEMVRNLVLADVRKHPEAIDFQGGPFPENYRVAFA